MLNKLKRGRKVHAPPTVRQATRVSVETTASKVVCERYSRPELNDAEQRELSASVMRSQASGRISAPVTLISPHHGLAGDGFTPAHAITSSLERPQPHEHA